MLNEHENFWTPWFQVYSHIFNEEKDGLEAMGFTLNQELLKFEQIVEFTGLLPDYPDRHLRISFPWSYPSIAPSVSDDGNCSVLPRHQQPESRVYCIYGPHGKLWSARNTAIDALEQTRIVINDALTSDSLDSTKDPYPEPKTTQAFFGDGGTILVPPPISDFFPNDLQSVQSGQIRVRYKKGKFFSRGIIVEARWKSDKLESNALKGYNDLMSGTESKGRLTFLPVLDLPLSTGSDFIRLLKKHSVSIEGDYSWHALIFPEQSGNSADQRFSWLVFQQSKNRQFHPVKTITLRSEERNARIPGLSFLAKQKVVIIGCGSLGSKIATSLAASGVNDFVLVDKDVMEPVNSIRHECAVNQFAVPKSHSLMKRIIELNPEATERCEPYYCDPFHQMKKESRDNLLKSMQNCTLIIDAVGIPGVSRAISQIGWSSSVPSIHVSVTNGAWSGEIFRQLPNKSTCWQCFQEMFAQPPPGEPTALGYVFGPGCDQPTFTGTTYDLDMVAGLASAVAVDTLRFYKEDSTEYTGDYLLWENRNSDGNLVQKTTIHTVPKRAACPTCQNRT